MRVEIEIPDEIIEEILVRIPFKSLLKFKCVSKSWSRLTSSKEFAKYHLKRMSINRTGKFLEYNWSNLISDKQLSVHHDQYMRRETYFAQHNCSYCSHRSLLPSLLQYEEQIQVLGSCNGLCCLKAGRNFFIWNPTTMEYTRLPDSNVEHDDQCTYGFGFDEFHDDYKLVMLTPVTPVSSVYVCSLRTNSWTRTPDIHGIAYTDEGPPTYDTRGKFVNGRLHWIWTFGDQTKYKILSFDLSAEVYEFVELPVKKSIRYMRRWMDVVDGCLCVVLRQITPPGLLENLNRRDIWMMKQYGGSWCLVGRGRFTSFEEGVTKLLHVLQTGEIVHYMDSKIVFFNAKGNRMKYIVMERCVCLEDGVGDTIQSVVSPILSGNGMNTI